MLLSVLTLLLACGTGDAPEAPAAAPAAPVVVTASGMRSAGSGDDAPPTAPRGPAVLPAQVSRSGGWAHFGTSFVVPDAEVLRFEELLADPGSHVDQRVRVFGRLADVCQVEGCWMVVTAKSGDPASGTIKVTMRDHAFNVDAGAAGRETEVEGTLVAVPAESQAPADGHLGTAGTPPAPTAGAYEIVASAVRIRNP